MRKSGHAGTLLKGWLEASPSPSLDMPGGDVVDMLPVSLQVQVRREHLLKCKYTTAQPGLQQRRLLADEELQNLVRQSGHVGTLLKGWLEASPSPSLDMPAQCAGNPV